MRRLSFAFLLVLVFVIPWQTAISGRAIYIAFLAFLSTLLSCILDRRFVRPPAFLFLATAFVVWQLVTLYWSIDVSTTMDRLFSMLPILALIWMVIEHGREEWERYAMLQAFVLGCVVLCGIVFWAYLNGEATDAYRYAPSEFSVNETADMLAAGISMALLSISMRRKGILFWLDLGFPLLALVAIVLTASRSGFVLAVVAMVGVVLLLWRTRVLYRLALVLALAAVFVGLFFAVSASDSLQANLKRVTFSADTATLRTMTNRTVIWNAGIDVFQSHPAGGVGAGNFNRSVQSLLGLPWSAHSVFVQTAAEDGVVGLFLLAGLFVASIAWVFRQGQRRIGLHTLLFLVLVGTAAVANFVTLYSLWFGLTIVALGAWGVRESTFPARIMRPEKFGGGLATEAADS